MQAIPVVAVPKAEKAVPINGKPVPINGKDSSIANAATPLHGVAIEPSAGDVPALIAISTKYLFAFVQNDGPNHRGPRPPSTQLQVKSSKLGVDPCISLGTTKEKRAWQRANRKKPSLRLS